MAGRDKQLERIKQQPANVRFATLDRLLQRYGFTVRQPRSGSSHYTYKRGRFTLTIPKHDPLREVYARKALKMIDEVRREEEA
ncbi:MAG: type II toxin-antitoxin system HicA family toxin [Acidobacteria bacterium]|nr:type II toxin-antitoxin system HicA family toxin [Acidobacteriota bacterium]